MTDPEDSVLAAQYQSAWADHIRSEGRDPHEHFPVASFEARRLELGRSGRQALVQAAHAWARARKQGLARYVGEGEGS